MTIDMVKFTAEVAKGISVGTKEVTIKLLIPLTAVESMLSSLAKMQEKEVMVYLGDPQGAFDFNDEDRDPMYNPWNGGRRVTTDSSGVVTKIEGQGDEQKDENQAELFDGQGNPQKPEGDGAEQTGDGSEVPQEGEGERISEKGAGEPPTDDLPDWMKEGGDESGSREMDFSSESGDQQPSADSEGEKKNAPVEIDKEALEIFILNKRPIFDDIKFADVPADFPSLLERRKVNGKTWLEISKEINIPSAQISSKYNAYKKRVTKMMQDGVAV
ncbi:hypothetical protein [Paenibacillus polysaccharolyticus]|uniref:hypothetical protein n=1 Tax=Paenibacillus polysaccharolyticus TaxID=582692 RepID=UPI00280BB06F|nr:hypothetical protein [Paenibacillus polysaccharolyticus]